MSAIINGVRDSWVGAFAESIIEQTDKTLDNCQKIWDRAWSEAHETADEIADFTEHTLVPWPTRLWWKLESLPVKIWELVVKVVNSIAHFFVRTEARVKDDWRQLVEDACEQLGYRPREGEDTRPYKIRVANSLKAEEVPEGVYVLEPHPLAKQVGCPVLLAAVQGGGSDDNPRVVIVEHVGCISGGRYGFVRGRGLAVYASLKDLVTELKNEIKGGLLARRL